MRIMSELPGLGGDKPVHRIGGSDLCDLFGITPGALTALGKRDTVVRLGHDAYDLEESTRRYVASLRETASGRGGEEQVLNLTGERARLAREQADAQALKNAVARGENVPAIEVERAWADILRGLRSRLLAVPSRLRQTVPHLTTSDVTLIDRELRDALQELGAGGQANADD